MNEIRETKDASGRDVVRLTARVEGLVQGVGFRDYVRTKGRRMGLVGSAANLPDGAVAVIAEGERGACEALLELLVTGHTPGRTDRVDHVWSDPRGGLDGFLRR
ncbi:acylphosphatase [Parafrankia colletiae]|uniref:acylphosphatase n=1 Tax=Parafrankia colletiae TaxID=573497 RepID=A0A1S1REZ2_9ACTN|nr:acylphosphatase [Parafrankia colletiae]MCK9901084.1 acylphosphatase [Frankia sp. Cpl3]OHV44035.1 acylphosphatase [Parafrankia colletiae]